MHWKRVVYLQHFSHSVFFLLSPPAVPTASSLELRVASIVSAGPNQSCTSFALSTLRPQPAAVN